MKSMFLKSIDFAKKLHNASFSEARRKFAGDVWEEQLRRFAYRLISGPLQYARGKQGRYTLKHCTKDVFY